ncbi:extracellular calcium-sensing receptor [Xenopus tropicalis]|uniref:Extracellular calcium-sensing receptor n=1 Tax=Xenopus tropicalis TaxID=8364 RepID=A0A8J0SAP0_XENTR|nr:extracellular calcium-sensing receptor [Xenopus tropicalis]|eukprot:XP_012815788.1 PREDICTED: extracellular calcium-sensing receptor-like [Xenopus tropicalis]
MVLCNMEVFYIFVSFILSKVWILCTLVIEVCASFHSKISCSLPGESIRGYLSRPGDIIIGGTFPIHLDRLYYGFNFTSKPLELQCQTSQFSPEYYQTMQAFVFAVDQINADLELLPNITLGFQILDTCISIRRAMLGVLWMLSERQETTPNFRCQEGAPLGGIVGESGSTQSILMAQILGLYRYPQISYFATSSILSNRNLFPSFFRTIPSDELQMKGLAQLVSHFGWSWVGVVVSNDDYGQYGIQVVKQELSSSGVCIAFIEKILTGETNKNAPDIVQVIKRSTAKVVVAIASDPDFVMVVEELVMQNLTGIIWVASEGWATSTLLSDKRFQKVLVGTIGFAIHGGKVPGFTTYLSGLHPLKDLNDSFLREFWEKTFSCKWNSGQRIGNSSIQGCTGDEQLEADAFGENHRVSLNVYTAVYAIAWALQHLLYDKLGTDLFHHGNCPSMSSFQPWQLFYYIKNVNFKTKDGRRLFFNSKGNPPAIYDIVNWQVNAKGALEQVVVGSYDLNTTDGNPLKVDSATITWANKEDGKKIPLSKCSPSCPSGYRMVAVPGKPPCCYECAPCPQGQISNQTDAVECLPCSWDTWPNLHQDRCLPRPTEFLSYRDPLGYSLAATAVFSSLITLVILGVFYFFKKTPIVRANNYSLSCLLLLSLFLCFLCSLGFIGYPKPAQCLLRQVAFGMVFALCISCVLAKTITVVIAFNATKPGSRLRKWSGIKVSYCVIVFCVIIQIGICTVWLLFYPPFSELDNDNQQGVIIINCNEGSPTAFWCMLGYLGLLASISFIVAFLARRLPDSFNEAKLITFSMLAFLSVWVSFIPAYLSARGMYTVAMEVFAILSSSWAMVVCIFVPKCFIVIFRPNKNAREHLMSKGRSRK